MAEAIDKKVAKEELGASGTVIYSGIITQEEYNRNLTGVRGNQTYEIMRRSDSTIRQALQIVKLPIRSTTWDIRPVQDDDGNIQDADQEKADFIKHQLMHNKVNFDKFIKEALSCLDFGFSLFEKVYEPTTYNGQTRIGLAKLASRKQVSILRWDAGEGVPGVTQVVGGSTYQIPREKLLIFSYDQEGDNYEGISLLRYVYKDWDMKDKLTLVNAMALEKHGMGMPIVKAREDKTPNPGDEEKAVEALSNVRANNRSYMKLPESMTVEFLDMKGSTTKEIIPTLVYHDGRIMSGVLARFMELGGASGTGSQSLSTDLSSIFMKSEEALAKELVSAITEDLIKQLCDLNYADNSSGYPKLEFGSIADDDTSALAEQVSKLFQAGAITYDPEVEDNLRERLRLPAVSKEVREIFENDLKEGKLPEKKEAEVVNAALTNFSQTKDVNAAIKAAREVRDGLLDLLMEK